jgi:hypothetical protein
MEDNPEQRSVSKKKFGSYMGLLGFKSLVSNGSRYFRGIEKKCVIDNDY